MPLRLFVNESLTLLISSEVWKPRKGNYNSCCKTLNVAPNSGLVADAEGTVLRMVILRVGLNIPVTAGTLLVLVILREGGPLPVVVKPCTVISNSASAIRWVARYLSALLTVSLTLYLSFPVIDTFQYKIHFQVRCQVAKNLLCVCAFIHRRTVRKGEGLPPILNLSDKTLMIWDHERFKENIDLTSSDMRNPVPVVLFWKCLILVRCVSYL